MPYDIEALERVAAIHETGDAKEYMRAGLRFAEALSTQSMLDDALEVYKKLLANDQESVILRESLAATYIKLHESKLAARELLFLAQRAWDRKDFDRELHYYRNVLAVDRDCEEVSKRIEEIERTRHVTRGRRRRRRVASTVLGLLLGCGLWHGTREWFAAEALHVASRAALAGLLVHPDDLKHMRQETRQAIEGNRDYNMEFRVVWPDASLHVVATRAVVLRDELGAPVRMIGACWDITDTKQREQLALLGSEVGDALTSLKPIQERLQLCAEGLVHQLDAALARIWTVNEAEAMLEIQASAGIHTQTDGTRPHPHRRI